MKKQNINFYNGQALADHMDTDDFPGIEENNNNEDQPMEPPKYGKPISLKSYKMDQHLNENPLFMPYYKSNYKLLYGTQHHYIFLRYFYTVYERLIKAKDVIEAKVSEDLAKQGE